jgi:hypothetical protein
MDPSSLLLPDFGRQLPAAIEHYALLALKIARSVPQKNLLKA